MPRNGLLRLAFYEQYLAGLEIGKVAEPGDSPISSFQGENGMVRADMRQHDGAAPTSGLRGEMKRPPLCDGFQSRWRHGIPGMKLERPG